MRSMHDVSLANRQASIYEKKQKRCIFPTFGIALFCTHFCIFSSGFTRQIIAYCMLNLPYFMDLSHIFPYKVGKREKRAPQNRAPLKVTLGPPFWPCMTKYGLLHEKYNLFSCFSWFLGYFWHITGVLWCQEPQTSLTYNRGKPAVSAMRYCKPIKCHFPHPDMIFWGKLWCWTQLEATGA